MNNVNSACISTLVIFGGTGDLAQRKLLPALARLKIADKLPDTLQIVLTGRNIASAEGYLNALAAKYETDIALHNALKSLLPSLHTITLNPALEGEAERFKSKLEALERQHGSGARLFYLAVPPTHIEDFIAIAAPLLNTGENACGAMTRIVVEKPFGYNETSARLLARKLSEIAREEQILRIDHYLAKETVQNIFVMRFANAFFEPIWNRQYIDHVQISFAEKQGVGGRAAFFDSTGILRDVVQNHLLQVLCLTAMEPPLSQNSESLKLEKLKILHALRRLDTDEIAQCTVRAQYNAGEIGSSHVPGYLEETGIKPDSNTETYAALRLFIDNWRWYNVPFYLRAGKRLATNQTEVAVHFKNVPNYLFTKSNSGAMEPNLLVMRIQPNEGCHLRINVKTPAQEFELTTAALNFSYQTSFSSTGLGAYEKILIDIITGNISWFISQSEIEAAWRFIDPIIETWQKREVPPLLSYNPGSAGPQEADKLLEMDGRKWRPFCTDSSCPW